MKYKTEDLSFKSKQEAMEVRLKLNQQAKKYNLNLVNRVLRGNRGYVVRASSKRK